MFLHASPASGIVKNFRNIVSVFMGLLGKFYTPHLRDDEFFRGVKCRKFRVRFPFAKVLTAGKTRRAAVKLSGTEENNSARIKTRASDSTRPLLLARELQPPGTFSRITTLKICKAFLGGKVQKTSANRPTRKLFFCKTVVFYYPGEGGGERH